MTDIYWTRRNWLTGAAASGLAAMGSALPAATAPVSTYRQKVLEKKPVAY